MIFRAIRRAVALVLALALSIFRYWLLRLRGPITMERRALWGQQTAKAIMACVGIRVEARWTARPDGEDACEARPRDQLPQSRERPRGGGAPGPIVGLRLSSVGRRGAGQPSGLRGYCQ